MAGDLTFFCRVCDGESSVGCETKQAQTNATTIERKIHAESISNEMRGSRKYGIATVRTLAHKP